MQNEWTAWSESERSVMEQILLKHGLRREDKNVHRQHLSVDDYKKAALKAEQINKLNAHINELKKKPVEDLTPEEVTLIKNQNDFMRGEIINRNETISELSKQVNAEFVTVNIYSPDKLQYIADGLARAKIPCVAESNTLYVPDYALKTAQAIASHYNPKAVRSFLVNGLADWGKTSGYSQEEIKDIVNMLMSAEGFGDVLIATITLAVVNALPVAPIGVKKPEKKEKSDITSLMTCFCDIMGKSDEEFWSSTLREVHERWERYGTATGKIKPVEEFREFDDD